MRTTERGQRDLFAQGMATAELQPSVRSRLAPLLRSLLTEAAGVRRPKTGSNPSDREAGDDQDHA